MGDLRAEAVFSVRIRAQMVRDRISSAQFFGVKTNILCALKKLYSLALVLTDEHHLPQVKVRLACNYLMLFQFILPLTAQLLAYLLIL